MLSSASPSFLEVSRFASSLKKSGRTGLRIGGAGSLGSFATPESSSILNIRICIQKLKVVGEMLSPCGRPLPRSKFLEQKPSSSRMQAVRLFPIRASHLLMFGPRLKNFSTLSRKLFDRVSKALAISMAMMAASMFLALHKLIDSQTFISTSCVYRLRLKPFCERLQILLTILSSLELSALESIL